MDNVLKLLGLSYRAGLLSSGEFSTEKAIKERRAKLVIVSEDASFNTKKKFRDKCVYYNVPCFEFGDKISLGKAFGQTERTSIAVLSEGFAEKIIQTSSLKEIGVN